MPDSTANKLRTAALLTPIGRGAVATIRVVGDFGSTTNDVISSNHHAVISLDSLFRAVNGIAIGQQPLHKIAFGQWGTTDQEDLVVCRPAQDELEIHCHGGDAAVQRILRDLAAAGFEIVDWKTQVEHDRDIVHSECVEILSLTSTWRTTRIALEQTNGLLRDSFVRLQNLNAAGDEAELNHMIDELLRWARFGEHLATPWSVVLTGRPNVGKSSLINALLGYQRAIVFDQPGTTRDVVTGETAFDGWPVVLADTAGIRSNVAELEAAGIAKGQERLQAADLPIVVLDLADQPTKEDDDLLQQWPTAIVAANKSDLGDMWGKRLPNQAIRVSSVSGEGIDELQRAIVARLVPEVPRPGTPVPLTARQCNQLSIARGLSTQSARRAAFEGLFLK